MVDGAAPSQRIAILFALPEEAAPFLRQAARWEGRIVTGISGMGARKAYAEAKRLLEASTPKLLLIVGFAGAVDNLQPGEALVASRVLDCVGKGETPEALHPSAEWLERVEKLETPAWVRFGTLATVARVLVTSAEKRAFAQSVPVMAVDMETAGAVRAAYERGVPWLAVRVVTDGAEDDLPLDFNALANENGEVQRGRIVGAILMQPWKIPALIRLGKRSSLAAKRLANVLETLLAKCEG